MAARARSNIEKTFVFAGIDRAIGPRLDGGGRTGAETD